MSNFFKHISSFLLVLGLAQIGYSQGDYNENVTFEIKIVNRILTVEIEQLDRAHTLNDLNRFYEASWVKKYMSMEILTTINGSLKVAKSNDGILTEEQLGNIRLADAGSVTSVVVKYIPDNTLSNNDVHTLDFAFVVAPLIDAKYNGGQQILKEIIQKRVMDKIPSCTFKEYDLAAIYFTISEEGKVKNIHFFDTAYQSFRNEDIEKLMYDAVSNMPLWKPAEYPDGTKARQEYVLTVGNMYSCLKPLLNIKLEEN